jgi:hypothetical protein
VVVKNPCGETALRPILPVTLSYSSMLIEVGGLLDTGEDVNVLPYRPGI